MDSPGSDPAAPGGPAEEAADFGPGSDPAAPGGPAEEAADFGPGSDPAAPGGPAEEAAGFTDYERERLSRSEFAVCVGTFYPDLAERLVNGAVEGFSAGGVSPASVHTFESPGAFELPLAAKWCAESGRFAGVACLGAVIRGETDHYEYVSAESARGIQRVQLETGIPCAFGVITCETMEQALARAGGDKRDQGRNAAVAVLRMALTREALR